MHKVSLCVRKRQIETFYAVMTYGTVTKAAFHLGVSQPSISITLKQAEKELGFALFNRINGKLIPTEEAGTLFNEVSRAHNSLVAIDNLCRQLKKGATRQLRLAAPQTLIESVIPEAVSLFVQQSEGYDLAISNLSTLGILQRLDTRNDEIDLGVVFGEPDQYGVFSSPIGAVPLYLVCPKSWQFNGELKSLHNRKLVALYASEPVGKYTHVLLNSLGIETEVAIRTQSHRLAAELVTYGLGFSILDALSVRNILSDLSQTQLVKLDREHCIKIYLVAKGATSIGEAERRFIASVKSVLSDNGFGLEEQ